MDMSNDKNAPWVVQIMGDTDLKGAEYNREYGRIYKIIGQHRLALAREHYDTATAAMRLLPDINWRPIAELPEGLKVEPEIVLLGGPCYLAPCKWDETECKWWDIYFDCWLENKVTHFCEINWPGGE